MLKTKQNGSTYNNLRTGVCKMKIDTFYHKKPYRFYVRSIGFCRRIFVLSNIDIKKHTNA